MNWGCTVALPLTEDERACNRCGQTKPLEEYEPAKRYRGGRMPVCRSCRATYRAALHARPKLPPAGPSKVCPGCEQDRLLADYCKDRRSPDGYSRRCLACRRLEAAKADPRATKDRYLRWRFGIGLAEYEAMHAAQGGVCKVCGRPQQQTRRRAYLDVDHSHVTGRVRGLLCSECNRALGLLRDDPVSVANLLAYLTKEPA